MEGGACPLAAPNRYLPARAGCVTALEADIEGDGRPALILVYSELSHHHPDWYAAGTEPPQARNEYIAQAAFLRVVLPDGRTVTTRIPGTRGANVLAVSRVNNDPGPEVFLQVSQISSGANAVAYGLAHGRLVPAGVTLGYGGDSGTKASFVCRSGPPPQVVQRFYELLGPTIYGWWQETTVLYRWHGPKLVRTATRKFKEHGLPPINATSRGADCGAPGR